MRRTRGSSVPGDAGRFRFLVDSLVSADAINPAYGVEEERSESMSIGPVQLIVLGFNHPQFHGEIIDALEQLRKDDTVRVIDALAVYKDAAGNSKPST